MQMREIISMIEWCSRNHGTDAMKESRLSSVMVKNIDLEAASIHFDLPHEDQFASKRQLISGMAETKRSFKKLFKGMTTIRAYRGMIVDPEWLGCLEAGAELGNSWAWDISGAQRFAGGSSSVILVADIPVGHIDWETTIAVNTFHPDEYEIVVDEGEEISLVDILVGGRSAAEHLKGQTFTA